ncbi:uncharacterized protein LOC107364592 [Tetranychus urticae]|uniref:Kinetochore protein SPC25 n=1 Tax=Tetranychus urticae TaxID=32264 RepID=T1KIF6_TETUR|nr:uncharacterized protein LOC107364592 [Tetranychus urticae]
MIDHYNSCLANFEQLLNHVSEEIPTVNHDKMRINKATVQHDIEQNLRELAKTFKKVKTDFEKAEKELNLKQQSVNIIKKSDEQLEHRLAQRIEAFEKKVAREKEKKELISSVFTFTEDVGFHFNVCQSENETTDEEPSKFKIGFSHIDPDDAEKIFSVTIDIKLGTIKVLEVDTAEEEFKELEKWFNEKFAVINLPIFVNRARKIFLKICKGKNANNQ